MLIPHNGVPQDAEAFKFTFTAQAPTSAGPSAPAEQPSAPRFSFTPQVPTTSDPSAPTEVSAQTPAEPPSAQAPQICLAVPVTHQGQQLYYSVDPGQNHEWYFDESGVLVAEGAIGLPHLSETRIATRSLPDIPLTHEDQRLIEQMFALRGTQRFEGNDWKIICSFLDGQKCFGMISADHNREVWCDGSGEIFREGLWGITDGLTIDHRIRWADPGHRWRIYWTDRPKERWKGFCVVNGAFEWWQTTSGVRVYEGPFNNGLFSQNDDRSLELLHWPQGAPVPQWSEEEIKEEDEPNRWSVVADEDSETRGDGGVESQHTTPGPLPQSPQSESSRPPPPESSQPPPESSQPDPLPKLKIRIPPRKDSSSTTGADRTPKPASERDGSITPTPGGDPGRRASHRSSTSFRTAQEGGPFRRPSAASAASTTSRASKRGRKKGIGASASTSLIGGRRSKRLGERGGLGREKTQAAFEQDKQAAQEARQDKQNDKKKEKEKEEREKGWRT
ncbi:hypothetical protein PM082_011947 [Marasmius tenuissimus]|nr:hypothetical protein PM082_011947 [Marasmius tenuissimus]